MAYWIIEDHGFGGSTYRCSECRDSWNDIYRDVSRESYCPSCKAEMNEESICVEKQEPIKVRVSVVKCKNCARYDELTSTCGRYKASDGIYMKPDDYCSRAVLKEDYELEKVSDYQVKGDD